MSLNIEHSVLSRLGLVSYSVLVKLNQDIYITNNETIKCCLVLHHMTPIAYFYNFRNGQFKEFFEQLITSQW